MKRKHIDKPSWRLGRFAQDCYLVARGVRMLGSHIFKKNDYQVLKNYIEKTATEEGVVMQIDKTKDQVEIIVIHPIEGAKWLRKLKKLDRDKDKYLTDPTAEQIFEKIVRKQKLTQKEQEFMQKMKAENERLEREYGKVFGYTESSIGRFVV